jgi:hypothetical protein
VGEGGSHDCNPRRNIDEKISEGGARGRTVPTVATPGGILMAIEASEEQGKGA